MDHAEFLQKTYALSVAAGMNQRYHQQRAQAWGRYDAAAKIVTALFATAGVVMTVITGFVPDSSVAFWFAVVVAVTATVSAFVLNVAPFGTLQAEHRELFGRWTEFRDEVEDLEFNLGDADRIDARLLEDLRRANSKLHRLCGAETQADQAQLRACYEAEVKSRAPDGTTSCDPSPCAA